ncbi:AAA family ATPase [Succinimonas sp.]|uniref:AAA family ATPase n=2 Tax=Succinimonas sp. TaxID=1936151 RepID=UPI003863C661
MGKALLSDDDMKRLPLGMQSFSAMRKDGVIYVDKTKMIRRLAWIEGPPVYITRPRRFGKSLLASAFKALFSGGLRDFKGLDIDTGENKWTDRTYKVVHLDFSKYASCSGAELEEMLTRDLTSQLSDICSISPRDARGDYYWPGFIIHQASKQIPDRSLVLLIEEYDSPGIHHVGNKGEMDKIMAVTWSFFATVKSYEPKFRFVFITGTARVGQVTLFSSAFDNLWDISSDDKYSALLGFTDEELRRYFDPYVRNAAAVLDMDVSEVYDFMKSQYGGFQFSIGAETTVYNPWSVLWFLAHPERGFRDYWHAASPVAPAVLLKCLENTDFRDRFNMLRYRMKDGILTDKLIDDDKLMEKSEPDELPLEKLLYQTGYFTLRQESRAHAILAFPNDEAAESLFRLYFDSNCMMPSEAARSRLAEAGALADSGAIAGIFEIFNEVLSDGAGSYDSSSHASLFDDENTVRDFIYALLPRGDFLKSRKSMSASGFSGMEIRTRATRLVIAFKMMRKGFSRKAAINEALEQLRTYDSGVTPEGIKLIRVGMVISPARKKLTEYQILDDKA